MADNETSDAFLDALNNLPDDILRAKYGGEPLSASKPQSQKRKDHFDRSIDLHGFTCDEAIVILKNTLMRANGCKRRLLIITGKGNNSDGGHGVIREAVLEYLRGEGSVYVRECNFAASKHGGSGSIEILTK